MIARAGRRLARGAASPNGGTAIEDPPGIARAARFGQLYLAYLRDPDGNKLCALHRRSP